MNRRSFSILLSVAALALASVSAAPAGKAKDEESHTVTIKDLKYDPAKMSIKAGQTVTWINKDTNDHTVIGDSNDAFKSENLGSGDTFKYTFKDPGKYPYHCKYHPRMKAIVVVE